MEKSRVTFNDPIEQLMFEVRIKTLKEVAREFEKCRREFSCGCPESRLCNHQAELDGYETAQSIVEDWFIDEEKKHGYR